MKKKANEYDNTFLKNIARVAVILLVVFVLLYSDRKPTGNLVGDEPATQASSEKPAGINADTISSVPESSIDTSSEEESPQSENSDITQSEVSASWQDTLMLLVPNDRVNSGELVLIDEQHPCITSGHSLTALADESNKTYRVLDEDICVSTELIDGFNSMMSVFMNTHNNNRIAVANGYISYDEQSAIYNAQESLPERLELDGEVEAAGLSEHQTGFALDLCIYDGSYERFDRYTPYGDYAWISENCHNYGFITRFDEDKTSVTSKQYAPWHLRYVGVAHACAMEYNNLCLEEYLDYIRQFTYEGNHLHLTDKNGNSYDIYYVPADTDNVDGETLIKVPQGLKYSISGDNIGGFIVTVES